MDKEIQSLDDHKVFDLVPLTTVPLKEKIKCHVSSSTKTGTAHSQEPGIDGPKSKPVCRTGRERILLAVVGEHAWSVCFD